MLDWTYFRNAEDPPPLKDGFCSTTASDTTASGFVRFDLLLAGAAAGAASLALSAAGTASEACGVCEGAGLTAVESVASTFSSFSLFPFLQENTINVHATMMAIDKNFFMVILC